MGAEIAVGAMIGVVGAFATAGAQQDALDAQRDVLHAQADAAKENARLARLEGIENARIHTIQSQKLISSIAPQYSASGVEMEGSVWDVIANSVQNAESDRLNILYQAELKAKSFETGSGAYAAAAGGLSNAGITGGLLTGIGGIIGGINWGGGGGTTGGGVGKNPYTGGNPTTGGYA